MSNSDYSVLMPPPSMEGGLIKMPKKNPETNEHEFRTPLPVNLEPKGSLLGLDKLAAIKKKKSLRTNLQSQKSLLAEDLKFILIKQAKKSKQTIITIRIVTRTTNEPTETETMMTRKHQHHTGFTMIKYTETGTRMKKREFTHQPVNIQKIMIINVIKNAHGKN